MAVDGSPESRRGLPSAEHSMSWPESDSPIPATAASFTEDAGVS